MAKRLSTFDIAGLLHVDPGSVANWIDQDILKAYRTPGGHRRVAVEDLIQFLRDHKMPIPEELRAGPVRVLVVDDEPAITQLVARAIKGAYPNFEVIEAHDGFTAGRHVVTMKPDMVILDLRMPGMDGFEVCRQIKKQADTKNIHVLAMTALPLDGNADRIRDCGAVACLSKPLDLDALLKEIANLA